MSSQQIEARDIIVVAADLFKKHGFYKEDLPAISRAVAINISDVQMIFENKVALAIAVMAYVQDIFDSSILVPAYDETITIQARIIKLNHNMEEYFINSSGGCVFVNLCLEGIGRNEAFKEPIQRYFNSLNKAYLNILIGIYKTAAAQLVADEFVADLQGALIMLRVTGEIWPIRRLSERFLKRCKLEPRELGPKSG